MQEMILISDEILIYPLIVSSGELTQSALTVNL